jgi:hypothetical protein
MLMDTFCQYGNLSIYFLALVFRSHILPFSYQGFSFLVALLFVGQFIIIYALLVQLVKNRFYAILLLLLCFLLGFFCTGGIIQAYPSTGPFRFGLAYMLLAVIILRNRFPSNSRVFLFIEHILIGFAFLWSFETFIYVGFSYIGILAYESFSKPVTFKAALKAFSVRLAYFLLSLILAVGLFSLFTYIRAKTLPNWDIYLDFIKSYSPAVGIGNELIDTWSPWIFPVSIYFSSLMFFLFRYFYLNYHKTTTEDKIILFLTFFGIAQFTYYLGRSHPNALFLISIPSVVIMGYWLVVFSQSKRISKSLGFASRMVFYFCVMLIILGSWPAVNAKIRNNQTGFAVLNINTLETLTPNNIQKWLSAERTLLHSNSDEYRIAEVHKLIKKYLLEKKQSLCFYPPIIQLRF